MKLSKILIGMLTLCSIVSITFASEITLSPATGSMGDGCKVAVDIIADTNGKTIVATDILMESSMEFVDFVPAKTAGKPGDAFPYFLPPMTGSNAVHIIGFVVDPSRGVSGKHNLGTAYFQKRSIGDRDGAVRLYFTKVGDTIDSNLSMVGGIDTLEKVSGAYYTFDGTTECAHEAAIIEGGIKNISLDASLEKISLDASTKSSHSYIYRLSGLVILIIAGIFYFAKTRKGKKAA